MNKQSHKINASSTGTLIVIGAVLALLIFPSLVTTARAQITLDPASGECVSCHETFMDPAHPGFVCHAEGCNHAIGIDYNEAASRRPALTPANELDPNVKLVAGRIGCTTCHVPYSVADHEALSDKRADESIPDPLLVLDNTGSALCLACHRM